MLRCGFYLCLKRRSEKKMDIEKYDGMSRDAQKAWWMDTNAIKERKRFVKHLIVEALNEARDVQGYLLLLDLNDEEQFNTGAGWNVNNMAKTFIAERGLKS